MKTCCKCKIEREESLFAKNKKRKDGLNPLCKICAKEWREANKEKLLAKKREYYSSNLELMREKNRVNYSNNKEKRIKQQREYLSKPENWVKKMLHRTKERAVQSQLGFDLVPEDIFFPEFCPVLGIKLTFELGKGQLETNASIDRIDSSKGYTKDNVQIISRKANTMKSNSTEEEQLMFALWVLEKNGLTGLAGTTLEKYAEQFRKMK